jgi:tetraacyldisaccharide 4'-kinase
MLARALSGIPILVSPDRYLAGSFAERRFGTTVSLLDDGFQHVQLERDIDLLLVAPRDLQESLLPTGTLREPLDVARFADALLVAGTDEEVTQVARALGRDHAFRVAPRYADLRDPRRVIAFAGIARPERFFAALRSLGWDVARELTFRDHHWFTPRDIATIERAAGDAGASAIITTEKDAARLNAGRALSDSPGALPLLVLQMTVEIEPAVVFESWLLEGIAHARAPRSSEGG